MNNNYSDLIDKQLLAYNKGDINSFVAFYSKDIEIYDFPKTLKYKGIEKLYDEYDKLFKNYPYLRAEVVNRIVYGDKIVDLERLSGLPNDRVINALVIYEIDQDLISKVYFIK